MRPSRETLGERMLVHGHAAGHKSSPTYVSWLAMRTRCLSPTYPGFAYYGGRGIGICEAWSDFRTFLADMGERPSLLVSLDRVDGDKDYGPDNCRWADKKEQRRNQKRNRAVQRSDGLRFRTAVEAAEATGGNRHAISDVCAGRQKTHRGWVWSYAQ